MKMCFILILLFSCAHQEKLTKVCLEGHTYFNYENRLALKVNDLGRPIKCVCKSCEITFAKNMDEKTKELVDSAIAWLKYLDEGSAHQSWAMASPKFKAHMSRREWQNKQKRAFKKMGKLKSRRPFDVEFKGNQATILFNADYEGKSNVRDAVYMVKEGEQWKAIGLKNN